MTYQVYISSTRKDLREYRQITRDTIWRLGMLPVLWEEFSAHEAEEKLIRESDLFVGIYAHRYGDPPPGREKSWQEMEYDIACRLEKPRLLFWVREEALWQANFIDRGEKAQMLSAFRRRVHHENFVHSFSNPHELQAKLLIGLQSAQAAKNEREGILTVEPIFGAPSKKSQFQCDVFMVMPFAAEFEPVYRDHIAPTVEDLKLTIQRADAFYSRHSIIEEIWSGIYAARLIIADCTGKNANVFYELGVSHAIGKTVVMLTQNLEDIPFDLRHLRVIQYENSPDGLRSLTQQLRTVIPRLL